MSTMPAPATDLFGFAGERVASLRAGTLRTRPMNKPVYDPSLPYGGHRFDERLADADVARCCVV